MKKQIQTRFTHSYELTKYFVNLFYEDEEFQDFLHEYGVYHSMELSEIVDEDLKQNGIGSRYYGESEDIVREDDWLFYETEIIVSKFKWDDYQFYLNRYAEYIDEKE
ncbi:hypothetical protein [Mycoplasma sp. 4404]|uniref:hypothetical protein n=1 Tax=Mycoplasma sp. 4404 TaxID=3108530 RepID=UPI002B1D3462|nr:hypothetical protein [Mycoplasma sp. 4404]MEA4162625.1 hypothetical protein [Mycoplasma sp. 4404]